MKNTITAALALSLLAGAALAQDRHDDRGGGREEHRGGEQGRGPEGRGGPHGPGGPERAPGPPPGAMEHGPRPGFERGRPDAERGRPGFEHGRPDFDRGRPNFDRGRPDFEHGRPDFDRGRPDVHRGPEPGFRPGFFLRDHDWREGRRFQAPYYRYPQGWGYRRWAFGAFLPGVFLAPDYFVGSYWIFGLPAPPPGYHWIRVGPDALLVRYGDGYILDVAYGIFF